MNKLKSLWVNLTSSLWFVPGVIVLVAILLAVGLIELSVAVDRRALLKYPRLFGAGAEGSRGMLAAIGGSMMTVAGVTFSLTLAALSQASSQYTPRILRNFMSDRANQIVLGTFVGIFTYCLIVLRTIRGGDEGVFVPSLAVIFAVALALVGIGFLIFFIHHIASSIQASNLIASASEETVKAIDRLFPQEVGESADETEAGGTDDLLLNYEWRDVPARKTGYVQSVDVDGLMELATERQTIVRMNCAIGDFVVERESLVSVALDGSPDEKYVKRINGVYTISRYRTVEQDAAFGVRQIVDIALKALSPGVNDTTTAVTCVDYLSAICARAARRRTPERARYDEGSLRVIARGATFESLLDDAFDQIRESAEGNAAVILRLLGALEKVARQTSRPRRLSHIAAHVARVQALADRSIKSQHDRTRIEEATGRLALLFDRIEGGFDSILQERARGAVQ